MDKVVAVQPLPDFMLDLTFADGIRKTLDIRPFIGKGLSAALADEDFFRRVTLESGGGICWPNGYDFCPNFMREQVPAVSPALA